MKITRKELRSIIRESLKKTVKYNADPALKGDQTKLPDKLQKGIIDKADKNLDEEDSAHLAQYAAPQGSKRDKQLDATKADLASDDPKRKARAYRRRERMERQEREKNEAYIRALVEAYLYEVGSLEPAIGGSVRDIKDLEEADLDEELSAKTKKSLDKKAEKRGFTKGSVYKEFEKGLAAYASSGSRKGMTAHQWAHARVNSANPSKDWAVVKKSKAKKKK